MLLLNPLPQLIPPPMSVPNQLLHPRNLIPEPVYLRQIRIRSPPLLVLRLNVLERRGKAFEIRALAPERVEYGAAVAVELGHFVLGALLVLAFEAEGVVGFEAEGRFGFEA